MQFNFDCEQALDCDKNGFSILDGSCPYKIIPGYIIYVKEILDRMGQLSARAQNLNNVITSTNRFFPSDHRLFIKADKNRVLGYIKVGPKKLFLRDRLFNYHERKTLCVLDFYVYETVQRKGIGKMLFDYMLNYEKINPNLLAYDRPTIRFLSFLKKNYKLDNYIAQNNNYIIFEEFFSPKIMSYNETQYDNETHRVIQSLNIPQNLNAYNYQENKYNRYSSNNNFNMVENENNHPRAMSPIGQQLIYSNDFKNTSNNKYNNRYQKEQEYNKNNNYELDNQKFAENDYGLQNNNANRSQDYQMNRKSPNRYNNSPYINNYNNQYKRKNRNTEYSDNFNFNYH